MAEILERSGYLVKVRVEVPAEKVEASYQALLKDLPARSGSRASARARPP